MKRPYKNYGFSLMELIGVMAVISIMAGILAPNVIDTIKRGFGEAESNNIKALANSLEEYILQNKQIPTQAQTSWVPAIAGFSELPQNQVEFNDRGFRRRLYIDPHFFSNSDTNFPGYSQTSGLTTNVISPRIILVSDLSANAPNPPTTNSAFSAIWEQLPTALLLESETVKIERLQLAAIFHRVLLVNSNIEQAAYSLEAGGLSAVPASSGGLDGNLTLYVLSNTQLNLFLNPFPTGSLNTLSIVNSGQSYQFQTNGSNWFWKYQ